MNSFKKILSNKRIKDENNANNKYDKDTLCHIPINKKLTKTDK